MTIRSTADKSVLFAGIIKGLKFSFNFTDENVKENNSIDCSLPGLAECKFYPFHILGSAVAVCEGKYDRVHEGKSVDFSLDSFSRHTFAFEKVNGEVVLTARLLKCASNDWFDTSGGGRRRRPPYELLHHEKTQGIGYAENIYLDPIKQLTAAGIGGNTFKWKFIERDNELIAMLIQVESEFWRYVQEGVPPPIDGSEASAEFLSRRFPKNYTPPLATM